MFIEKSPENENGQVKLYYSAGTVVTPAVGAPKTRHFLV